MKCCGDMETFSAGYEKPGFGYSSLRQFKPPRRRNAILYRCADGTGATLDINFCPWCGANLNTSPPATVKPMKTSTTSGPPPVQS